MSSSEAFAAVLEDLIEELLKLHPEDKRLLSYQEKVKKKENSHDILESFMIGMSEHKDLLNSKDDTLFETKSNVIKRLHLNKHFQTYETQTKNIIWEKLQTLNMLGTTIQSVPQSILSSIESFADSCSNDDSVDISKIMKGMHNILGDKV